MFFKNVKVVYRAQAKLKILVKNLSILNFLKILQFCLLHKKKLFST